MRLIKQKIHYKGLILGLDANAMKTKTSRIGNESLTFGNWKLASHEMYTGHNVKTRYQQLFFSQQQRKKLFTQQHQSKKGH